MPRLGWFKRKKGFLMSRIPDNYKGPGYGTIYSDSEIRTAIAIAEVFDALGIGGGGGGITQGQVTTAIEDADNLAAIATDATLAQVRDRLPTNSIFKQSVRGFRVATNFTRPADTSPYAVFDAITNSTSAPTTLSFNLNTFGASNGDFICFTNARIISSVAQSTLLTANLFVFNQTFAATNDNLQLSIDDATAQTGGVVIPCLNTYNLSANARCVSDAGQWIMKLADASTSIFFALQATNAYTPVSGERFDVILEGFLL